MSSLDEAQNDWDNVQEIVPQFKSEGIALVKDSATCGQAPFVSLEEVVQDFKSQDLTSQKAQVEADYNYHVRNSRNFRFLVTRTVKCLRRPTPEGQRLVEEERFVMAVAKCPFDNGNPLHFLVLLTLFKKLTGDTVDRPRYGSHWEQIGFQGNDPATDLRGVGFLGLVQPLHLVTRSTRSLQLARDIYQLSQNESQEFPLMVLSINVTRIALCALRDDLLSRLETQEGSALTALNLFYSSLMLHIYTIWKSQNKTIKDSGFVLKEAERYGRKNVRLLVSNLHSHLNN